MATETQPVEDWGLDGAAMVVDEERGALVPASSLPGYQGLDRSMAPITYIPVAPAWRVRIRDQRTGHVREHPILAWSGDPDGQLTPVPHRNRNRNDCPYAVRLGESIEILPPGA